MPTQTLVRRVETLERQMSELSGLPARVTDLSLHVSQLQVEMHSEFSAIRGEIEALATTLRAEIRAGDEETQREMRFLHAEVVSQLENLRKAALETVPATLRAEIRAGDEETRHQMRVLHEDIVGRLALLQEGLLPRRRTRGAVKKKGSG